MSYSWDDAFIQAMQHDSRIRNKVAAAPLPGAKEVWNRKTGKWDKFETPSRAPYITWGWTSAVSKTSKNKDMAFDFLCFFSNEANTTHDLQIGRFGVNPFRNYPFRCQVLDRQSWAGIRRRRPPMSRRSRGMDSAKIAFLTSGSRA